MKKLFLFILFLSMIGSACNKRVFDPYQSANKRGKFRA
jgi:hypothetical protein